MRKPRQSPSFCRPVLFFHNSSFRGSRLLAVPKKKKKKDHFTLSSLSRPPPFLASCVMLRDGRPNGLTCVCFRACCFDQYPNWGALFATFASADASAGGWAPSCGVVVVLSLVESLVVLLRGVLFASVRRAMKENEALEMMLKGGITTQPHKGSQGYSATRTNAPTCSVICKMGHPSLI